MLPEEAAFIGDLRARVLANMAKGLPPHTGLDREELKKAVALSRSDYTANQSKSKASGVSNPSSGPSAPLDLQALFAPGANSTSLKK